MVTIVFLSSIRSSFKFKKIFFAETLPSATSISQICLSLGCEILAKAEFCNGGGSVKDRAAYYLIKDAEEKGTELKTAENIYTESYPILVMPHSVEYRQINYDSSKTK